MLEAPIIADRNVTNQFQSPWSGQICLNSRQECLDEHATEFQSPWSGQICLNAADMLFTTADSNKFQSPWSGQICLN